MMNTRLLILIAVFLFMGSYVRGQELSTSSVPVVAYHRFGDDRYASTNITMEEFRKQLSFLKENSYNVLTLRKAVSKLTEGTLDEKTVVLTVDDGYLSFFENAFPLLKRYGYPVTIFVNTEYVGGADFMNWEQLREISKSGMEIGNHSHQHPHFLNKSHPEKAFTKDIRKAQRLFKKHLGEAPGALSYPYGEYSSGLARQAAELGFYAATAQRSGVMSENNLYAIPRFPMGGPFAHLEGFKNKIQMKTMDVRVISPNSTTDSKAKAFIFNIQSSVVENTIQCFIDGTKQELSKQDGHWVVPIPQSSDRRLLLTVTAQLSDSGGYGWFSQLLIKTEVSEK